MKTTESKAPTIQVLGRMFSLLDVLASYQDPVSLKIISEQTGLHPSTAHRILNVLAIGGRAPLHLTSVGKLFLAHDDAQRVRAYATRTGLAGHTRNSITNLPTLERALSKVLHDGTARDDEELEL